MWYVYASLCVNLCEGINCYKSLPKQKTIIEDPVKIIQDFKTEIRFYFINNKIDILRLLQFNERTDKIVVYFCGCSFGEIPIVL